MGYQDGGMTLTQMSDLLTRDDSGLNLKINKMSQDLEAHKKQLTEYESKIIESGSSKPTTAEAQSASSKEEFGKLKQSSEILVSSHGELLEEFAKMKQSLHNIIESLAAKEQNTDLEGFLRRESNFNFAQQ